MSSLNCPHCGISLDAPPEGCVRWGLNFGHPFTSCMEMQVFGKDGKDFRYYVCRECNGTWTENLREKQLNALLAKE